MKRLTILLCFAAAAIAFALPASDLFKVDASIYVDDRTVDLGAKEMSVAFLSGATSAESGTTEEECPDPTPGYNCGRGEIDDYTVLLFHFDGNYSSFYEDCSGATTSPHGETDRGTKTGIMVASSAYFGDSGVSLDGTTDYIEIATGAEFYVGTQDFTLDYWTRIPSAALAGTYISFSKRVGSQDFCAASVAGVQSFYSQDEGGWRSGTTDLRDDTWHHIAWVRTGTTLLLFVDGVKEVVDTSYGHDLWDNQRNPWCIGWDGTNAEYWGDIDEFRWSIGIARWTETFAVPTEPY